MVRATRLLIAIVFIGFWWLEEGDLGSWLIAEVHSYFCQRYENPVLRKIARGIYSPCARYYVIRNCLITLLAKLFKTYGDSRNGPCCFVCSGNKRMVSTLVSLSAQWLPFLSLEKGKCIKKQHKMNGPDKPDCLFWNCKFKGFATALMKVMMGLSE